LRLLWIWTGPRPGLRAAARNFGRILAENKIRLVYGGGSVGLMGALATAALDHGGAVTGIIPEFLTARELAITRVQELIVTRDLHERKRLMFERCDAFVALPGGIGTLEELVEQLTWAQLGRHKKPILLANIEGFWEPLLLLIEHMRSFSFLHNESHVQLLVADQVKAVLPRLTDALRNISEFEKSMTPAAVGHM
jgi:uncharacterized protein (TIGR00730 family)